MSWYAIGSNLPYTSAGTATHCTERAPHPSLALSSLRAVCEDRECEAHVAQTNQPMQAFLLPSAGKRWREATDEKLQQQQCRAQKAEAAVSFPQAGKKTQY